MIIMSKYNPLWKWINKNKTDDFKLTFAEIENIAGVPIDHSFLTFKKELLQYGFKVVKISMKEQTVDFEKVKEEALTVFLPMSEMPWQDLHQSKMQLQVLSL